MAMRALQILLPLALPVLAAAQSQLVLPASHAAREGTGTTNLPFGRGTPTRVQSLYDRLLFQAPVTITALAFRVDGGATATSKLVDCEIHMSTRPGSLLTFSVDFAQNRGADETIVLPRQVLTLPADTAAAMPNAFLPAIPLATPFAYDPQNGALVVEVIVHGQPPGTYPLDVTYVCNSPEIAIGPAGCPQPSTLPLRVQSSTTSVIWGRPWIASILDAEPGAFVAFTLGTQESGPWNGFVLPQELSAIGAPGCWMSIDIGTSLFAIAAADGSAQFPFLIPNNPAFVGAWLLYQAAAVNLPANTLGIVTSQAQKVQVCGWEPVGRVWSSGTTATIGTRELGVAPVIELTVQ
ncbi:MAG: hypothetical protein KDE27_12330 [Planctomycetes bacterium]|nr:hypothetical protein [Planctomycetota bacterium]